MFDCARFRNRDFENSLIACNGFVSDSSTVVEQPLQLSDITHIFLAILIYCKMDGSE